MASYRVLIVDDQREVRQLLRSAIETLEYEFDVVDVPSAEEALLEATTPDAFDLLIVDVLLPGMSGLELLARLRERNPDLSIFLITGVVDAQVRQQVADAGADAFFLKPVETADFLDAVERCLGLIDSGPVEADSVLLDEPSETLSDRLTNLRKDLDGFSAVLLDDYGRVLARAGDLPDASAETALFPALMAAFGASEKVTKLLGATPPRDLMYFSGSKYDIFLAHIGAAHALLVAANPLTSSEQIQASLQMIHAGMPDLLLILENLGVSSHAEERPSPRVEEIEEDIIEEAEDAPVIEALFKEVGAEIKPEEADAFWDDVSQGSLEEELTNADALTYEQARQLGLTPEDDSDG
jgi:CheY-like chemotaxis protein